MHNTLIHRVLHFTLFCVLAASCGQAQVEPVDNEVFLHQAVILQDGICASVDYDNGDLMFLSNTLDGYNYAL